MNITKELFGKSNDSLDVYLFTFTNNIITVKLINYGGIITSILVPDKNGKIDDIVLGFKTLKEYQKRNSYFGTIIGRYANRIAKGIFSINGIEYKLALNDGKNHLHGGNIGFDKVVWRAEEIKKNHEVGVRLSYISKDMEEGYPGNLDVSVDYILNKNNELLILYEAICDKLTIVNLTHHSYFNLAGEGKTDILDHKLMINADRFTEVDGASIPTGEIREVKDTPLDFTTAEKIGSRIKKLKGGYDHNYVLNKDKDFSLAAKVFEPVSGRIMEVFTTEPGLQFYSSNYLDGSFKGKSGKLYDKYFGFCLEAQHFPDSPNHPEFPATLLKPQEIYRQKTVYVFSY
ncbi:MAG: galactose mutarotase [Spirochaetes bacterium]|nr:galactose mutarotase [Spirochaetota bacterium]